MIPLPERVGGNGVSGSRDPKLEMSRMFDATAACRDLTRMVDERAKGFLAQNRRWEHIENSNVSPSAWN